MKYSTIYILISRTHFYQYLFIFSQWVTFSLNINRECIKDFFEPFHYHDLLLYRFISALYRILSNFMLMLLSI